LLVFLRTFAVMDSCAHELLIQRVVDAKIKNKKGPFGPREFLLDDQHCITIGEELILFFFSHFISFRDQIKTTECSGHHQEC
jgi:hypothetical protein